MFVKSPGRIVAQSFAIESRPGPLLRDALIAAAAEMALADGRVEPSEPYGLLEFLKKNAMLANFGRTATMARFRDEVSRVSAREDSDNNAPNWHELMQRLRPLAGMEAGRIVSAGAAYVAAADGVIHHGEIALLRCMRDALGVTPPAESPRQ